MVNIPRTINYISVKLGKQKERNPERQNKNTENTIHVQKS